MKISKLYEEGGPLRGEDVYVIGLGPSLRVMPMEWLEGRCCVLLNDAWRHFPRLGPVAFLNSKRFATRDGPILRYVVVKGRSVNEPDADNPYNHVDRFHKSWYVFSVRVSRYDGFSQHDDDAIFKEKDFFYSSSGGTVAEYAVQFACWAGARTIFLVGIDCRRMGDDDYFSDTVRETRVSYAVNKKCFESKDYSGYAAGLLKLKDVAMQKFKVPVMSLTPFIGLGGEEEQYAAARSTL